MSLAGARRSAGDEATDLAPAHVNASSVPRGDTHTLYAPVKRVIDVVFALGALVVGTPLIMMVAFAVALEAQGPVLFRGQRVGRYGRPIRILKFRTMGPNSDAVLAELLRGPAIAAEFNATYKIKNDPRCTRLGRFLRRTSLDELPQLWNVLLGDMSLVGPRPIVEDELPRYRAIPSGEAAYLMVKPGLTGVWQVSGRSDTTYEERVHLDIEYFRTRGLVRDILIIARTPRAALGGHGAY